MRLNVYLDSYAITKQSLHNGAERIAFTAKGVGEVEVIVHGFYQPLNKPTDHTNISMHPCGV